MLGFHEVILGCMIATSCLITVSEAARLKEHRTRAVNEEELNLLPGFYPDDGVTVPATDLGSREFTLRHIYHHGASKSPDLHAYLDIPKHTRLMVPDERGQNRIAEDRLSARAVSIAIQRMADRTKATVDGLLRHAELYGEAAILLADAWTVDMISGPNTTDKATVLSLAHMAANAYVTEPFTGDWQNVNGSFNYSDSFGWDLDGLRGHIFADELNSTIVIGLKGTSMAVFDGAETTGNDKDNDNLFGSCCCGQGGQPRWKQVCECMTSAYTCNSTCLLKSLQKKNHYYSAARNLYHHVKERYPTSHIWVTGHSLGGVVGALLGLTYGLPVMTYEAYPDALAASRLGLPVPPGYKAGSHQTRGDLGIYHYGHTADPVYMGICNSALSLCTLAGYAMQGVCHSGKTCQYDTVTDLGWRVSIGTHRILNVISDVLERYDDVPVCETDTNCQDCFNWKFYESNDTERSSTTRSSTNSLTRTRTVTCKTPGWWGCLDRTTSRITTNISSSTTSTCKTPGWWGCRDATTTESMSTRVIKTTTSPVLIGLTTLPPTVLTTYYPLEPKVASIQPSKASKEILPSEVSTHRMKFHLPQVPVH